MRARADTRKEVATVVLALATSGVKANHVHAMRAGKGWVSTEGGAFHPRVSRRHPSTSSPFLRVIHACLLSHHGRIGAAMTHGT